MSSSSSIMPDNGIYLEWLFARVAADESTSYHDFLAYLRTVRPMLTPTPMADRIIVKPQGRKRAVVEGGSGLAGGR